MSRETRHLLAIRCDSCAMRREYTENDGIIVEFAWEAFLDKLKFDGWQIGDVDLCPKCADRYSVTCQVCLTTFCQPDAPTVKLLDAAREQGWHIEEEQLCPKCNESEGEK